MSSGLALPCSVPSRRPGNLGRAAHGDEAGQGRTGREGGAGVHILVPAAALGDPILPLPREASGSLGPGCLTSEPCWTGPHQRRPRQATRARMLPRRAGGWARLRSPSNRTFQEGQELRKQEIVGRILKEEAEEENRKKKRPPPARATAGRTLRDETWNYISHVCAGKTAVDAQRLLVSRACCFQEAQVEGPGPGAEEDVAAGASVSPVERAP